MHILCDFQVEINIEEFGWNWSILLGSPTCAMPKVQAHAQGKKKKKKEARDVTM